MNSSVPADKLALVPLQEHVLPILDLFLGGWHTGKFPRSPQVDAHAIAASSKCHEFRVATSANTLW